MEIREASEATLKKYGLTRDEWRAIWVEQGMKCPICEKTPKTQTPVEFNIDHQHVRGWKKMSPEEKKKYVRGIVCGWCNRSYLAKGMTIKKAKLMSAYLEKHEKRKTEKILCIHTSGSQNK